MNSISRYNTSLALEGPELEAICELTGGFAFRVSRDQPPELVMGSPRFNFEAALDEFSALHVFHLEHGAESQSGGGFQDSATVNYFGYAIHVIRRRANGEYLYAGIPLHLGNQQMLDALPVGVMRISALGNLTFANSTMETLTGYSEPELEGKRWRDLNLFDNSDLEALFDFFAANEDPNLTYRAPVSVTTPMGQRRRLLLVGTALRGRRSRVIEYLITLAEAAEPLTLEAP